MNRHQIESMTDYVSLLRSKKGEAEALFKEMLIGVTVFFAPPKHSKFCRMKSCRNFWNQNRPTGPFLFGYRDAPQVKKRIRWLWFFTNVSSDRNIIALPGMDGIQAKKLCR